MSEAISSTSKEIAINQRVQLSVPLSDLSLSKENMRKGTSVEDEFVNSIEINGVIQPLLISLNNEVVAGRRRYNALKKLLKRKVIPADYLVPCFQSQTDDDLLRSSIAENLHRQIPHPAEYQAAIKKLNAAGHDKNSICQQLQITSHQFDSYLRLANLHPRIFKAYASNLLTHDQAKAFGATDDKKLQLSVWEKSGFDEDINPYAIKRAIRGDITSEHPIAAFVGIDDYQEAGGKLTHDLFENVYTFHNVDLVDSLASQKMEAILEAFKEREPEWKWYTSTTDRTTYINYPNVHAGKFRKLNEEQTAEMGNLKSPLDKLLEIDEDDLTNEQCLEIDRLEDELIALNHKFNTERQYFTKKQMQSSGVHLSISDKGHVDFKKGIQTKADLKQEAQANTKNSSTGQGDSAVDTVEPDLPDFSQSLTADLEMNLRAYTKAQLLANPMLATDLLDFSNITSAFARTYTELFHDISVRPTNDESETNSFADSKTALIFNQAYEALPQKVIDFEQDIVTRFKIYRDLSRPEKEKLLTYVSAMTFSEDHNNLIASETKLNPRDYWTPDEPFFFRLRKPTILKFLAEFIGDDKAAEYSSRKKGDLSAIAGDLFDNKNTRKQLKSWVPAIFKRSE